MEYELISSPRGRESRKVFDFGVESSWLPVLTFATPGDLSVAYQLQVGTYARIYNQIWLSWGILTSGFTHTTASGNLKIDGIPFPAGNPPNAGGLNFGTLFFEGITLASYTQFIPRIIGATSRIEVLASGQGQAGTTVAASHMPTGGTVRLYGALMYSLSN